MKKPIVFIAIDLSLLSNPKHNVPHIRKNRLSKTKDKKIDYESYYSEKSLEIMYEIYGEEIELFKDMQ